jgi:hypothetical protein
MADVPQLLAALHQAAQTRAYVTRLDLLAVGQAILKARLYLKPDLFVQVYRNDKFQTTNFVLIHAGQRIYARDELAGAWHRHPVDDTDLHDRSPEGQRRASLEEFLDEIEKIVTDLNLL